MDGYDQLWSLVEADGADGLPGLIGEAAPLSGSLAGADDTPVADLQVDVSALEGIADGDWTPGAVLAGAWAPEDDFFPIHAPAAYADPIANVRPGVAPQDDTPLILPTAQDGAGTPEPLVLPGLMTDEFMFDGDAGGPLVRPVEPDVTDLPETDAPFLGRSVSGGAADMPVDHTVYLDDHGLIGAHGADDWLLQG